MRIAAELGLAADVLADLYYSLLLKDAGCSSNASQIYNSLASDDIAAKRDVKKTDSTRLSWETLQYALTHVAPGKPFLERVQSILRIASHQKRQTQEVTALRCERGASMARLMGLAERIGEGISGLDEHWNGCGNPDGIGGNKIPISSRIMLLAQTLDIYYTNSGAHEAWSVVKLRSGKWFDPAIVQAAHSLAKREQLWTDFETESALAVALSLEPGQRMLSEGDLSLDAVCQAFAQIVDAKSPFTYNHSNGVANAAVAIAQKLGLAPARVLFIRHAALLHDLGKMGVSNSILEKPGKPDAAEWQILKAHPAHTWQILQSISGFGELAEIAASHHEKLNGTGYHRGLVASQMPVEARILVVSDIFDALAATRPYREALPVETVLKMLRKDAPHALDASCVEALEQSGAGSNQSFTDLEALRSMLEKTDLHSRPKPQTQETMMSRYSVGVYE
jgi:putative nucleotidyltransferase with HDIG domain